MIISLIKSPDENDLKLVKQAIWVTMGREDTPKIRISPELLHKILLARHSPIRLLNFTFLMKGIPSNTATHLARHVHALPFISSLRNDRQQKIDGDFAPRNTPVNMMFSVNAEELMTIANKRLCAKAAETTRYVVRQMCGLVEEVMPELKGCLVPNCEYHGGVCYEIEPCGRRMIRADAIWGCEK